MLTDAQVRKIKPAEKKTKYSDEKGMYLEVIPSSNDVKSKNPFKKH
ncbi:hypothetical protein F992_00751 [Acinetobacter modestus]|jgi:hypothetical protein|uniref:DUF4102 domain-containing protein n=1 Tax=Acinetobacter modestus TaxID=1776740 RepID=A0ABN0JRK9_9GAMM|nr:hypothetical protein F992_00751 [Acinetobacter modestus]GGA21143.1 hypothetical protein GCM10017554_17680 [Acinetobacter modestus]